MYSVTSGGHTDVTSRVATAGKAYLMKSATIAGNKDSTSVMANEVVEHACTPQ